MKEIHWISFTAEGSMPQIRIWERKPCSCLGERCWTTETWKWKLTISWNKITNEEELAVAMLFISFPFFEASNQSSTSFWLFEWLSHSEVLVRCDQKCFEIMSMSIARKRWMSCTSYLTMINSAFKSLLIRWWKGWWLTALAPWMEAHNCRNDTSLNVTPFQTWSEQRTQLIADRW